MARTPTSLHPYIPTSLENKFSAFLVEYNVTCDQVCMNTDGGYKCDCTPGYRLDVDGVRCSPVVECSGTKNCEQHCVKIDGKLHKTQLLRLNRWYKFNNCV